MLLDRGRLALILALFLIGGCGVKAPPRAPPGSPAVSTSTASGTSVR